MTTIPVERELLEFLCSNNNNALSRLPELRALLSEQPQAGAGQIGKAQWWLAKLDRYGNPTLTDGQHDEQAGANRAFYLHRSFGFTGEERYAVAKVELFEPVADSTGVNQEAVAIVQAGLGSAHQPAARHDQGDEVRRLREALITARPYVADALASNGANMRNEAWRRLDLIDAALTPSPKGEEE